MYLRCCTDDAFASFVSSRSLSVRGSWGTAPSVFWYGVPGGTQGPLGKGGAAERWRVAYPIGIATRHGAKPATTHTSKRNASAASGAHHAFAKGSATPLGEKKLSAVNPSGSFHSPPPFTQGRLWVGARPAQNSRPRPALDRALQHRPGTGNDHALVEIDTVAVAHAADEIGGGPGWGLLLRDAAVEIR